MARLRKKIQDPNQYSLFDIIAHHVEEIREENVQDDLQEQPDAHSPDVIIKNTETIALEPESAVEASQPAVEITVEEPKPQEPVRLGLNADGASVYKMPDGSRMYSRHLGIMRVEDGDKNTPEDLYVKNRHEFLTIQEVAHFRNEISLVVENPNAAKSSKPARNRSNSSQSQDDNGYQAGWLFQQGISDTGSLGVERPGGTEETGSPGQDSVRSETVRPAADGGKSIVESQSARNDEEWIERLGDIANTGNPDGAKNYRITEADHLGSGGAKSKFADNIAAIRLLKQLQTNNAEYATPEEKKILVRYVGWGGLPQAFDPQNEQWAKEYQELQGLLTHNECRKMTIMCPLGNPKRLNTRHQFRLKKPYVYLSTPVYMGGKSQTTSSLATQLDRVFVDAIPPCGTGNNTSEQRLRS